MIGNTIDPRLAVQQTETKDLIRFKQEMNGLKERLSDGVDTKEQQLKKACQNFEAVFIGKLWQQMKQSVPKEGYLHSKQEDSYMGMFDKEFSEKMAQGGGIGLADMIFSQLSEKLKETSKTTLSGGVDIKPLVPQPIAVNQTSGGIALPKTSGGMTLEDWGGTEEARPAEAGQTDPKMPGGTNAAGVLNASSTPILSDMEVQARLDDLVRRLEAERERDGVSGAETRRSAFGSVGSGYDMQRQGEQDELIGRKLAEIG
ncbi:flagellar biosynthesis protein FlgJ [Pseudodesulfovibrio sp. JC047]|uniref:rod-binding protein n=1 Tax=Pseudodesulfovibrio sp. JC047 TaxID=2683199 RepID=UPI0013D73D64|nr:rod-binding protein [Pseudodesulfovibrio sp. JC047]NDV17838.1 flagellar biosynthesis protein FlgJ [Pseudodesulfovibrio sp. JC047]